MTRLSKYFWRYEIACKCGCGYDTMDAETLKIADEIRELNAGPITPNSGARCEKHNKEVGGAEDSQHLIARAMDLPVKNPLSVFKYLTKKYPDKYGIGLYKTFVHIDTRKEAARWLRY